MASANRRKRPTSLSINEDLLTQAKAAGLNLSQAAEEGIARALKKRQEDLWLEQNAEAIDKYNDRIERGGVFSDGLRRF